MPTSSRISQTGTRSGIWRPASRRTLASERAGERASDCSRIKLRSRMVLVVTGPAIASSRPRLRVWNSCAAIGASCSTASPVMS